jgi:hypothetical protein
MKADVQERIPMPPWAVVLFVGLILNLLMIAYSAGLIVSRVGTLQDRFNYLEMRFNEFVERNK